MWNFIISLLVTNTYGQSCSSSSSYFCIISFDVNKISYKIRNIPSFAADHCKHITSTKVVTYLILYLPQTNRSINKSILKVFILSYFYYLAKRKIPGKVNSIPNKKPNMGRVVQSSDRTSATEGSAIVCLRLLACLLLFGG